MTVDAVGGVWRYALDLCRSLDRANVDVLLVGLGPPPDEQASAEAGALRNTELLWTGLPLDWMAESAREVAGVPDALLQLAQSGDVDLLHLNLPTQVAADDALPTVAASHSCLATWWAAVRPQEPFPEAWHWHRRLTADGFRRADIVVAPSDAHAAALRAAYGEIPNLLIVYNGSSVEFGKAPKEDVAVSLGRWWDAAKNARALDDAAALCGCPVRIAGPLGGGGAEFRPLHAEPLGNLDRDAARDLLARASIFVSPALFEPFGLAILEAARARCALALSDIPTFRELWEDAAVFVDPHDPRAIADGIESLRDSRKRRIFAAAAADRARTYTLEAQARKILDIYTGAMSRQPELAGTA